MNDRGIRRKELKCPTCKIVHPIEPDVERKVVFMTSSKLHNVFLDPAVRLPFHLDVESICGARLTDMMFPTAPQTTLHQD